MITTDPSDLTRTATRTFTIRRGADGWERWDHLSETWLELPPHYANVHESAAREYAAGFYGVRPRQIQVVHS